jgi:tetratricopeptide (TPR) repeat protein
MRWLLLLALLVLPSLSQAAPSAADRDKAKALFESGTTHYNLSEYADALKDFKETYRLVNDPALLYNIAQCQRQLGAFEDAARAYRSYRREYPDAPNRAEVDRLIAQMDDAAAKQRAANPPPPVTAVVAPAPSTTPAVVATAPERQRHKRALTWGLVAGAVVVVAAGVTVGVVLGTAKKDSTPQLPDVHF